MKVLNICLCGSYNDGWGYHDNYLSYYHQKLGHDVTIITTPFINDKQSSQYLFSNVGEYVDDNGIKIIRKSLKFYNKSKFSFKMRLYKDLYKTIEKENPDIIFIHCTQFYDIRKIIKYKKKHMDVKIFADNHSDYINSATNFLSKNILHKIIWKSGVKKLVPYCEKIFGVTPQRCEFMKNMYGVPENKIELLVMGADDEKIDFKNKEKIRKLIRSKLDIEDNDFVIITGGKIDPAKNIDKLMQVVQDMEDKTIKLIVFGSVNKNIEDKINALSNSANIRNIGWIPAGEVYNYFLASDLGVFPGTHSTLWEQACGTGVPCVFKKWEGMTHVDVGGNCKFLENDSLEGLSSILKSIIYNPELYNNMKDISIKKAVEEFSYSKIAKKSIEF